MFSLEHVEKNTSDNLKEFNSPNDWAKIIMDDVFL